MGKAEGYIAPSWSGRRYSSDTLRQARYGATLTRDLVTQGQFSIDRVIADNPVTFTYGGNAGARPARIAYQQAVNEISTRRAVGQSTPSLREVRRTLRQRYGVNDRVFGSR